MPQDIPPLVATGAASNDFFGAGSAIFGSIVSFTELLAVLLVQTLQFSTDEDDHWIAVDVHACIDRILADEQLFARWERFFLRGAGVLFNEEEITPKFTCRQKVVKGQLTSAMEVFAFGHEYGYQVAQQSTRRAADGRFHREFAADQIAWSIAQFLGARGFAGDMGKCRNAWLEFNSGAVAILRAAQLARCVRQVLQTGAHQEDTSHPTYFDRLFALEKWSGYAEEPLKEQFAHQRQLFGCLLPRIFNELRLRFWAAHQSGYRPIQAEVLRDRLASKTNAKGSDFVDFGLVDILVDGVRPQPEVHSEDRSDSVDASALITQNAATDGLSIAREYLQYYQEKSVQQLAEWTILSRIGFVELSLSKAVTSRLRTGRTDGTSSGFQGLLQNYCDMITQTCAKLNLPVRGGVVPGVVWHPALSPAQLELSDKDTSFIVIPNSTMMLCYFIGKLLVKAFSIRIENDRLAVSFDAKKTLARIRSRTKLRKFAAGFIAYCATGNPHCLRPLSNASGDQRPVAYQLLTAIELFVVAHEYSHHILEHGLKGCASVNGLASELSKEQELQADWHAALITANIGAECRLSFAYNCTAGVIALIGSDLLNRARSLLATGKERPVKSDSHPPLEHRLLMLEKLRYDPRVIEFCAKCAKRVS